MQTVDMHDHLQTYSYSLTEAVGERFADGFAPELSPQQMLELGVFGGNYFEGEYGEFPQEWFAAARLSDHGHDPKLNFFGVDASQSRQEWQRKGWIYPLDPRGWFQWYCRYFLGRRLPDEDDRQIRRWKNMTRHIAQVRNSCQPGDWSCHSRQRQALLHWAYDSRKI